MKKQLALIVEDDIKLGDIFSMTLQTGGYETRLVNDGEAALAFLAEFVPAIIVLDLHLPGVAGQTLLQRVRADARLAQTKVIVATADALLATQLENDSDLVLLKPVSPLQLRELASRLHPAS